MEPLFAKADEHGLNVTHILLTHHHGDHVAELGDALERYPDAHRARAPRRARPRHDRRPQPGRRGRDRRPDRQGAAHPRPHRGDAQPARRRHELFTGDTLFKGSVGGVRAPGSHVASRTSSTRSWTCILTLPPETVVRPGHTDPSTVADELENNPFVRIWRGLDAEGSEQCTALGDPATLVLWGPDYDGGHKAWVRWPDGSDDIVPGSRVER